MKPHANTHFVVSSLMIFSIRSRMGPHRSMSMMTKKNSRRRKKMTKMNT
ncbi:unnamed protein product [Dibothriocephalus latus]|uniref:Uncharacterized protein n=1 Tax=Dibothriocephalus latus TaxID=60516 RepID=A0A3P7L750_DIBLA|nr:unnamed protein product [Dibothriocephalus latus]